MNLAAVPADVAKIVFPVSIYDAENRQQSFGQVRNAFIRVVNQADDSEIARYDLSEDASTETAMVFGELYRNDGVAVGGERILPAGWTDHGRTWVAHDDESAMVGGADYGRHWWMWPKYPGSIAAHGHEGQYIVVVPDRELTVVHLGKTDADVVGTLLELLDGIVASTPVSPS